uniref:Ycf37 n=1 Tax=Anunuuluaehu liula TaxID=3049639 RepID=UPI003002A63A
MIHILSLYHLFYNNIMLKIYLICLITFLFPICLLITREIYKLFKQHIISNRILKQQNSNTIDIYDTLTLAKIYIKQKKWISSILTLEYGINKDNKIIEKYYNWIGFCYCKTKVYNLSKYYYLQAIQVKPNYISALHNLAEIYKILNDYQNATNTYKKIIQIDNKNTKAKQKFDLLSKQNNRDSRI